MEKTIQSSSINRGLILGGILSLITVIGYAVYQEMYTNWWFGILLFIFIVTYSIVSAVNSRKLLGGFIKYKDAFTSYLITVAIGTLISTVISIIIFNLVDPEAGEAVKEKILEFSINMMEKFGAPKDAINEAAAAMENENPLGAASQIFNWFKGMVFYIVIGLLASLAIKKEAPMH